MIGDIGASLPLLAKRLEGKLEADSSIPELRQEILGHINERAEDDRFPVTPQRLVHDVRAVMPEDGIVCLDNGMYKIWFARNYRPHVANTLLKQRTAAVVALVSQLIDGGACQRRLQTRHKCGGCGELDE